MISTATALYNFFSGFDLPAYNESTIPDDAEFDSQIIPNIKKTKILCHEGSSTEEKAKYYGLNYEAVSSD